MVAAAASALFAQAPAFPDSKAITFVVPYTAGGPTDRVARDLAEALRKAVGGGANLVVENINVALSQAALQAAR